MRILWAAMLAAFAFLPLQASAASAGYTCKGSASACSKYNNGNYKKYYKKKSYKKRYTTTKRKYKAKKRPAYAGKSKGRHYQTGIASYYWQPQKVASGGYFNPNALTAAHKTLPFGTRVRVTHLRNGRSVVVRINDRGPYIKGRIIDLSKRAAGVIGMQGSGIARVRVDILGKS
ncbi:MAG: septal ring lytic transglycosylase RlpA family protein [Pseudomonadota bacterium]